MIHGLAVGLALCVVTSGCGRVKGFLEKSEGAATATSGEPAVVKELAAAEYSAFIATPGKVVVVDFHADWCPPCRKLAPDLKQVAGEFGDRVVVGKIDVDQAKELATQLGVSSIPDVRIFRNGVMVDQFLGALGKTEIRSKLEQATSALPPAGEASGVPAGPAEPVEPTIQPMKKDWMPPGIEQRS